MALAQGDNLLLASGSRFDILCLAVSLILLKRRRRLCDHLTAMSMLLLGVVFTLSRAIANAQTEPVCYIDNNAYVHVGTSMRPCGATNATTPVVACCNIGAYCLEGGLCYNPNDQGDTTGMSKPPCLPTWFHADRLFQGTTWEGVLLRRAQCSGTS